MVNNLSTKKKKEKINKIKLNTLISLQIFYCIANAHTNNIIIIFTVGSLFWLFLFCAREELEHLLEAKYIKKNFMQQITTNIEMSDLEYISIYNDITFLLAVIFSLLVI